MKNVETMQQLMGMENENFRLSISKNKRDGWVINKKTSEPEMYIGPDFFRKESQFKDELNAKFGFNINIVRI